MQKKKLSIKDIAADLNTSITAVSFVINGKAKEKRISEELEATILAYIKKNNYQPSRLAQGMRTGKTNTIGLLVEDISNLFFANVARIIEDQAYARGYKIIYCSTENKTNKTKELLKMLTDFHVDAFIVTPPVGIEVEIQNFISKDVPVVLFDRFFPFLSVDHVVIDNRIGSYNGVKHLLDQGFRKVAMVTIESEQSQMEGRKEGYIQAVKEAGVPELIHFIPKGTSRDMYIQSIADFIRRNKQIDGIFFSTNYLTLSGLEALEKSGKVIPDDIGVVAFDDQELFKIYKPHITAVAQPIEEMSLRLIDLLLQRLVNKNKSIEKVVLSPKLIIRESSLRMK